MRYCRNPLQIFFYFRTPGGPAWIDPGLNAEAFVVEDGYLASEVLDDLGAHQVDGNSREAAAGHPRAEDAFDPQGGHLPPGTKPRSEPPATNELRPDPDRIGDLLVHIGPEGGPTTRGSDLPKEVLAKRFAEADRACVEKEQEIRNKREELRKIASEFGCGYTESLNKSMRRAYDRLNDLMGQAATVHGKFTEATTALEAERPLLKAVATMAIPAAELDSLVGNDPVAGPLAQAAAALKAQQAQDQNAAESKASSDPTARQLAAVQTVYDQRIDELKETARDSRRFRIEREMAKWEALLAKLQGQREDLAGKIRKSKEDAYRLGRASVDVEMLRAEIKDLESVLRKLVGQREDLRVALNMARPPRVQPVKAKAEPPKRDDIGTQNLVRRFAQADDCCVEKEQDNRNKREGLEKLAEEFGTADPESLTDSMLRGFVQLNVDLTRQAVTVHGKYAEVTTQLEAETRLLKSVEKMPIPAAELDSLVRNDRVASPLAEALAALKVQQAQNQNAARSKTGDDRTARQLAAVQTVYDQRIDELREKVNYSRRLRIAREMAKWYALRRFAQVDDCCVEKEQDIRNKRQELRKIAEEFGTSDPESLADRMRHAYDRVNSFMTDAATVHRKDTDATTQLEAERRLLKAVQTMAIPAAEMDSLVRNDPVAGPLATALTALKVQQCRTRMPPVRGPVTTGPPGPWRQSKRRMTRGSTS